MANVTTKHRGLWFGGFALIALAAAMGLSNPPLSAYERYATIRLTNYANDQLCVGLPAELQMLLGDKCTELLQQHQELVAEMVRSQTQRNNYWFFSLYQTTLALPGLPMLPQYQVRTVGIFGHFLTFQATQSP